jgi:hypothetical protein
MAKQMLQLGSTKNNEDTSDLVYSTKNTKKTNEPQTLPKQTPLWNNRSQNRSRTHLQNKPHNKRKSHNTRQRNRNNKRNTSQYDSWKHIPRWMPIGNGPSGMRSSLANKQWNMEKTPIPPRKKEINQRHRTLCDSRSPKNGKPIPNRRQRNGHTIHLHRFDVSPEED